MEKLSDCPSKKEDENDDREEKAAPPCPSEQSADANDKCKVAEAKECSSWVPENGWDVSSWVNSAKEKTKSTFELIKKDIHEFSDTLHNETNSLVTSAAKKAQLIGQIIAPTPEDDNKKDEQDGQGTEEDLNKTASVTTAGESPTSDEVQQQKGFFGFDWVKQMANEMVETVHKFATEDTTSEEAQCTEQIQLGGQGAGRKTLLDQCTLLQMQNDRRTFLQQPQRGAEFFDQWLNDFKISEYNAEINLLLGENSRLREIYAELVPSLVDNHTFWHRYFFKVHVKEAEKQGQERLKLDVDKKGVLLPAERLSPVPSNGSNWSMCSSNGRTTEAEVSEPDATPPRERREDAPTPRPKKAEEEADDWEECEGEADNESKTLKEATTDGQ